jgi:hypothetical protein
MSNTPNKTNLWVTFAAVLGGFAIFALIITIAYLPQRPEALPEGARTPEQRVQLLQELRAKEQKVVTSYTWIDQNAGQIQLPLDRAVELTIQELNSQKK